MNKSEETMEIDLHMNWIALCAIIPRRIILGARTLNLTIPAESGKYVLPIGRKNIFILLPITAVINR